MLSLRSFAAALNGAAASAALRPIVNAVRASQFSSLDNGTEAENAMHATLASALEAVHVKVTDVSGGCGSMFDIEVASAQFAGQSRVKQHRMVNEVRFVCCLCERVWQIAGILLTVWNLEIW